MADGYLLLPDLLRLDAVSCPSIGGMVFKRSWSDTDAVLVGEIWITTLVQGANEGWFKHTDRKMRTVKFEHTCAILLSHNDRANISNYKVTDADGRLLELTIKCLAGLLCTNDADNAHLIEADFG